MTFNFDILRDHYHRAVQDVFTEVASGSFTHEHLEVFSLMAGAYQVALHERTSDANLEQIRFVRDSIERQTAAEERMAEALERIAARLSTK